MKTLILNTFLILLSLSSFAMTPSAFLCEETKTSPTEVCDADSMYISAMETAIAEMDSAKTIEQLQANAYSFERILTVKNDDWLPRYYAAFDYIIMSFKEKESSIRDQYLDKAEAHLEQAMIIDDQESELVAMQGYLYQARMSISPMARGMQYGKRTAEVMAKAVELNPNNPRAHFFSGLYWLYAPSFFGGGTDKACPFFTTAKEKFQTEEIRSCIHPSWGEGRTDNMISEKCK